MSSLNLYGNVHFISFFSSVLARLAYFNDMNFLEQYNLIMGPIIPDTVLNSINSIVTIPAILNDEETFNLTTNPNNYPLFTFENKKYIAFNEWAKKINMINAEVSEKYTLNQYESKKKSSYKNVNYISIATSNYGEIYIVADKRMPTSIWVLFRGTYSGKTAASYSKPTSVIPLYVGTTEDGTRESYLFGIFKLITDSIHTIIEAMRYLSINFLKAKSLNSIKVFTAGHSLGGALSTIFAYIWMRIKKTSPYNSIPYNVMSNEIFCGSLGAPRCFNNNISLVFCKYIANNKITYIRIVSRGDPVTALPMKMAYFSHPCSDSANIKSGMREKVNEDCNGLYKITLGKPAAEYYKSLDCSNKKSWRPFAPNPLKHVIYLNILYRNAVDIVSFLKSMVTVAEIERTSSGSTECRLIYWSTEKIFKAVFFDLSIAKSKVQDKGSLGLSNPKDIAEDDRVTAEVFDKLIAASTNINKEMTKKLPMQGILETTIFSNVKPNNNVCITLKGGIQVENTGGTLKLKIGKRKKPKTRKNKGVKGKL